MYILKNAIRNIWRNRARSIPIGAIMLVTVAMTSSALTIQRAAVKAVEGYRDQYGSVVTISPDIDKIIQIGRDSDGSQGGRNVAAVPGITSGQYIAFAQSDYLKGSSLTAVVPVTASGLKAADRQTKSGSIYSEPIPGGVSGSVMPTMKIVGDSDTADLTDFKEGLRKIVSGSMYAGGNECVVSAEFAGLNNLHAGEAITVEGIASQGRPVYRLTVAGIYSDATDAYPKAAEDSYASSFLNRRNEILTSFETAAGTDGADYPGVSIQAEYYLKSPRLLEAFTQELRKKGLPDAYTASADTAGFEMAAGQAKSLRTTAIAAAAAAAALGGTAFVLLTLAGLKRRRREIGALRLMGMKQRTVAQGLLYETVILAFLCFLPGFAAGAAFAQPGAFALSKLPLSDSVIQRSVTRPTGVNTILMIRTTHSGNVGISSSFPRETKPESLRVEPDAAAAPEAALIALAFTAAASAAALRFVKKNNPMKTITGKP